MSQDKHPGHLAILRCSIWIPLSFLPPAELEPQFQKKVSQEEPVVVPEKKSINLATSVTPENAEVKWFKDGTEIKGNKKYEIRKDGASRTLTVKQAEAKDSGVYTCEVKSEKQQFQVQVQGERN